MIVRGRLKKELRRFVGPLRETSPWLEAQLRSIRPSILREREGSKNSWKTKNIGTITMPKTSKTNKSTTLKSSPPPDTAPYTIPSPSTNTTKSPLKRKSTPTVPSANNPTTKPTSIESTKKDDKTDKSKSSPLTTRSSSSSTCPVCLKSSETSKPVSRSHPRLSSSRVEGINCWTRLKLKSWLKWVTEKRSLVATQ